MEVSEGIVLDYDIDNASNKVDPGEVTKKVCDDYNEYISTTKDERIAVLMSYEEYSAMKETMYLLSSKNNRDRLNEAVGPTAAYSQRIDDPLVIRV